MSRSSVRLRRACARPRQAWHDWAASMSSAGVLKPLLVRRRGVLLGGNSTFAEKELLHLLHDPFLVLTAGGVQAVFVQDHLAKIAPLPPGFLRHVLIDFLAQLGVKGRLIQSRQFLLQLNA